MLEFGGGEENSSVSGDLSEAGRQTERSRTGCTETQGQLAITINTCECLLGLNFSNT